MGLWGFLRPCTFLGSGRELAARRTGGAVNDLVQERGGLENSAKRTVSRDSGQVLHERSAEAAAFIPGAGHGKNSASLLAVEVERHA